MEAISFAGERAFALVVEADKGGDLITVSSPPQPSFEVHVLLQDDTPPIAAFAR